MLSASASAVRQMPAGRAFIEIIHRWAEAEGFDPPDFAEAILDELERRATFAELKARLDRRR